MNIAQHLLGVLALDQDRPAIDEAGGRQINRGEFRRKVLNRASRLVQAGLTPGDRVAVQAPAGIEFAVSSVAILVAGGVLVLVAPDIAPVQYVQRMADAEVGWIVVDRRLRWIQAIPGLSRYLRRKGVPLPPDIDAAQATTLPIPLPREAATIPLRDSVQVPEDSDAAIIFTGGTTATPKGVRLSHRALQAYLSSINVFMDRYSVKTYVADTPQQILYGLYLGIGVWIPRGRGKRRAEGIAKCLSRGGAQMFFGPPYIWNQLLDRATQDALPAPANLRLVLLGGAPVSDALLTRLRSWLAEGTEVRVLYGLTEIGPVCSCTAESRLSWTGQGNLVGTAMPGVQMTIVDPGPDGTGELELRSPSVYSGYVGQESSEGVLRTGDLARVVEYAGDQQLVLMGRKKDMIIRRGVNIYPATLEPLILQTTDHSGQALLRDCSLVGVWNADTQDEEVFLFYVPVPAQKVDPGWLRERLSNLHGAELAPDLCVPIDKIPEVGRQHKPDKRALRASAEQMRSGSTQDTQIDLPVAGYGRDIEN